MPAITNPPANQQVANTSKKALAAQLIEFYKSRLPKQNYAVAIDNIVQKGTNTPAEFSEFLHVQISKEMSNHSFIKEYPRRQYQQRIIEEQPLRKTTNI
ncbi:hypothetical protein [Candidatus Uabimicrobium amorphum]|uniref:Uncharacterized protein n=1 Tax=Uabimicrobium amorphum TaxID=2596890 RepID=A0A5S9IR04_UABAM|nr:hypothetical protein [Candidatus Uabimicrobium amorphum]BBM86127.1 hypothetical protein UABAM_04513 [Candidatus Uabimicrobium amorphum]